MRGAKMGEENVETVAPLHAAPFWRWKVAWMEPAPGKGETWPAPIQAALHRQKCAACKGVTVSMFSSPIFAPRVDPTPPLWGHGRLLVLQ